MLLTLALAAGCNDSNGLADPTNVNTVDTVTLGALEGTPIQTPSAFAVDLGPVRTDQVTGFEFAYNVDSTGRRVFLPRKVLGLSSTSGAEPGLQASSATFAAITVAPSNGYVTDSAVPVAVGQRWLVRSRVFCTIGVPQYAKLEILSFQDSSVTFQVLADNNCGYKGLEPGLPDR
ncbi:MAG TPA: hypothetical protein VIG08_09465 [Gemmatimonadales bacterium]